MEKPPSNSAARRDDGNNSEILAAAATHKETLNKLHSVGAVSMTPELFEKLYLNPMQVVPGDLRKRFGNPTPIGLAGFLLTLMPLACDLMGWRGAGKNGAATIGSNYFLGGLLSIISGIMEWILGNTLISVVFFSFGGFYLATGADLTPTFNAIGAYAPPNATSPLEGAVTTGFNASYVCALRTNVVYVGLFMMIIPTFGLLTGEYWVLAQDYFGNAALAHRLQVGAGACAFVVCIIAWYIEIFIMFETIGIATLPVGDLSHFWEKPPRKNEHMA
ncbi:uncharacterized protein E0L32_011520 [Thyridium curvatum]|uniref:Uncharacterized protein n=1 Tax=Thyridium curvatum TaxID=1093900 RepID=A0A507BNE4_9PEZI|nr:uncharacterized protein E0L32_011520 [Thyridium curvatum]TPX18771.1 hypothetical protein E0L32_011520 [Thyridium curvatum]